MDGVRWLASGGNAAADHIDYDYDYDGTSYRLHWWKGYYLNLGAGGEGGTYTKIEDSGSLDYYQAAPIENTPLMSVTVRDRASGQVIAESAPDDAQQWVFASNSRVQGLAPGDLLVEYSITFPSDGMYEAFRTSQGVKDLNGEYVFGWNPSTRTVTYGWRRRRRRR